MPVATAPPLPVEHPQRSALHDEIHARPPEAMAAPLVITHLVLGTNSEECEASRVHLAELLRRMKKAPPDLSSIHLRVDLGPCRLRWELHTEFVTWTFFRSLEESEQSPGPDEPPSIGVEGLPERWLQSMPGKVLTAMHLWVLPDKPAGVEQTLGFYFNEATLVGSRVAGDHASAYTDFAIHADGYSRMVLLASHLSERPLGRTVQRLLEIETYRMAALLGLPVARRAANALGKAEAELAALADSIRTARRDDEPLLLDRLTRLAGEVESQYAATHSRFSASAAYFELIDRRLDDLTEAQLGNLQTIGDFIERRLSPARSTCAWVTRRQEALSQRVSRASNLLRTRVEIEQQQSSRALLATMNDRQNLQLKLQSTVEGLSVAAITYYIVGLIGYIAKAADKKGWLAGPEIVTAAAVPVVALCVWASLRRLYNRINGGTF